MVQVWLAMECFGCDKGQLRIYTLDQVSKTVTLFGVIHFRRKASFFDQNLAVLSSVQYARFLKEYFEHHQIFPSEKYFDVLAVRLASRPIFTSLRKSLLDKTQGRRPLDRTFPLTCPHYGEGAARIDPNYPHKLSFKCLFQDFSWVRTSKKQRLVWLDEETRLEVFKDAHAALCKQDQEALEEVLGQLKARVSTEQFQMTQVTPKIRYLKVKYADANNKLLKKQLKFLEEKQQRAAEYIEHLKDRLADYKIMLAKKNNTQKPANNSKRRKAKKIRKNQATSRKLAVVHMNFTPTSRR